MFFFLAFCFLLSYFAVAIALAAFIISRFFKNKKAAFLKIAEKGLPGSLAGLVRCLLFRLQIPMITGFGWPLQQVQQVQRLER